MEEKEKVEAREIEICEEKEKVSINTLITVGGALIGVILSVLFTHYFTLKEINYENSVKLVVKNMSEEELLGEAEKYFATEDYIQTANIYNLDVFATNSIALNNLGYMYEHGILFGKDLERARDYYKKAAKLGNMDAIENYMLFTIMYPNSYKELMQVLQFGYENNSKIVDSFIGEYIYGDSKDEKREGIKHFFTLEDNDKEEILKLQMYSVRIADIQASDRKDFIYYEQSDDDYFSTNTIEVGKYISAYEFENIDGIYKKVELELAEKTVLHMAYREARFIYGIKQETKFIKIKKEL